MRFNLSRILLASGTMVLAGCAALSAFAGIARGTALNAAEQTGWAGGEVYVSLADLAYLGSPQRPPWRLVAQLTERGLAGAPLSPRGLSLIGSARQAQNDERGAMQAMTLSQRLSRRDFLAQLWFINYAALSGDIDAALHQYDLALRTQPGAPEILFPLLARALADPGIEPHFVPYVRARPPWLVPALNAIATSSPDPGGVARTLVLAGGLPAGEQYRQVESMMLGQLVSKTGPEAARDYFLTLKGAEAEQLRQVKFSRRNVDPDRAPMTWGAVASPDAGGRFRTASDGVTMLEGSAAPGAKGLLARKLLFLPPGRYRLAGRGALEAEVGATLSVLVSCASLAGTREIARLELRSGTGVTTTNVPEGCVAQFIDVVLDSGTSDATANARIDHLRLSPAP